MAGSPSLLLSAAESPGRTPEPNRTPEALPLYPKGAPESNGLSADSVKVLPDVIFGAVDADYLVLPADPTQATGQAVVICPGGGYGAICFDHEGLQVARWFNTQGVTAIVLRYRMPNGHPEIPLKDAQQMLELVRKQAPKWRVDPHRVGIIGFSAGGHLAAAVSTLFTGPDNRPDFTILCYAAISDDSDIIDKETFGNLTGPDASTRKRPVTPAKTGDGTNAAGLHRPQRRRRQRLAWQQHTLLHGVEKSQCPGRTSHFPDRRSRLGLERIVPLQGTNCAPRSAAGSKKSANKEFPI